MDAHEWSSKEGIGYRSDGASIGARIEPGDIWRAIMSSPCEAAIAAELLRLARENAELKANEAGWLNLVAGIGKALGFTIAGYPSGNDHLVKEAERWGEGEEKRQIALLQSLQGSGPCWPEHRTLVNMIEAKLAELRKEE